MNCIVARLFLFPLSYVISIVALGWMNVAFPVHDVHPHLHVQRMEEGIMTLRLAQEREIAAHARILCYAFLELLFLTIQLCILQILVIAVAACVTQDFKLACILEGTPHRPRVEEPHSAVFPLIMGGDSLNFFGSHYLISDIRSASVQYCLLLSSWT
ncbi:hypothetical protein M422DRAFT_263831 [Sphaerobolus stellatus SS14]|uniref:Uncharacterized protein n=1 Tax=Sphaerobolus stellatus (strain SS14) TaxID=990650 RepID=A0A0C9VA23_SPHS4|nr:hypothetical protein M422DRAFT_263831 [Sphaerobolus stellatus SS14]